MYRVSLGLVGLLLAVLLVARNVGLLPDPDAAALAKRQAVCEAVAIECAMVSHRKEEPAAAANFSRAIARRHPDIVSLGIRDAQGRLVADIGGHESHWRAEAQSTPTQMSVDVPKENGSKWARVEVTFRPLPYSGWWRFVGGSMFPLLAFVWAGWFIVTILYLRTVFRRVDMAQARVVPDRVKNTLDTLSGDPVRLRQIVINLVGNAIKFTERGEVLIHVGVDRRGPEDVALHFAVTDTGIGIPADKLEMIFEPFTQADSSTTRRFGGTGLGLTISAHLVELMQGRIWAESCEGHGSTFHFTAHFGVPSFSRVDMDLIDLESHLDSEALIVVENTYTRRILIDLLKQLGLSPFAVQEPSEALAALLQAEARGRPVSFVFLDSRPADSDSFELARRMRVQDFTGTLVFLLPTTDLAKDIGRCQELGATHLRKPIRRADLLRALQHVSGKQASRGNESEEFLATLDSGTAKLNILVAEDNPFNQKVARMKLERLGHRVTIAGTGREALDAMTRQAFDLLFTDVQMPDMDGYTLTARIRDSERGTAHHLPIVAMTAHAMKGVREECLAAGMDDYITKPIEDEALIAAIRRAVHLREDASETLEDYAQRTDELRSAAHVNIEAALERVGGDSAVLAELIGVFQSDTTAGLENLREALAAEDAAGVRACAHTLKGMLSFFDASSAVRAATELERAGERGDLTSTASLLERLDSEIRLVQDALDQAGMLCTM